MSGLPACTNLMPGAYYGQKDFVGSHWIKVMIVMKVDEGAGIQAQFSAKTTNDLTHWAIHSTLKVIILNNKYVLIKFRITGIHNII